MAEGVTQGLAAQPAPREHGRKAGEPAALSPALGWNPAVPLGTRGAPAARGGSQPCGPRARASRALVPAAALRP